MRGNNSMDTEAMVRVRMGSNDAHYGGDLVDGAKMLSFFGDIATELLIRHDGTEGLFLKYTDVTFLKPVFAGDYIEATGEIIKVGNTSRTMKFVAKKVISALRSSKDPSAAEFLEKPYIVCEAVGVCVAPKKSHESN
jgi:3-aminobutyryl-CoA ammonia-lyase